MDPKNTADQQSSDILELREKIRSLEAHLKATDRSVNYLAEFIGVEDFFSLPYSTEEVEQFGGFIPAYLDRKGVANHVDLRRVLAGIEPRHRDDQGRVHPAFPWPGGWIAARQVADADEIGGWLGVSHGSAFQPAAGLSQVMKSALPRIPSPIGPVSFRI